MKVCLTCTYGGKEFVVHGTLNDSPTARAIAAALPIEARADTWGDELYFRIPVEHDLEPEARDLREVADLAYWPPGRAMCVFFGRTPASRDGEPRAASPVNLVGRLDLGPDTVAGLKAVPAGARVTVRSAETR